MSSEIENPQRLAALKSFELLDSPSEESFDRLTRLVQKLLNAPVALVSLVDSDRQFFKSAAGLVGKYAETRQTPLSHSFCQHVVESGEVLVVNDADNHPLVCSNLAIRDLGVKSYLGFPILSPDGFVLGSFCAIDTKPRDWSQADITSMRELTALVVSQIALDHANRSQRKADERLGKIASRVPGVIYQFRLRPDGSSHFPYASDGIRSIYKVEPQSVSHDASAVFALIHPEDLKRVSDSILISAETLKPWRCEFRVRHQDGSERWLLGDSLPERESDGSTLWHGFITDVTERKLADERLRNALDQVSQQQFSIDQHAIVVMTDLDGQILYANDKFIEISGYSREELVGVNHRIVNSGFHPKSFFEEMFDSISKGRVWHAEFCNRKKTGEQYWVATTIVPFFDVSGKLKRYVAIGTDITAQFISAENLRRANAFREAILASAGYLIVATDVNGLITKVNPAVEAATGYTALELEGHHTPAIWHDEKEVIMRAAELSEFLGARIEPGFDVFVCLARIQNKPDENEWTFIRKDKSRFSVRLSVTCMRDRSGAITGYVGVISDISESKKIERSLRESEERFRLSFENAGIAHATLSPDGTWKNVNRAMIELLGFSEAELRKKTFQELTHPDDLHFGKDLAPKLISGEIPVLKVEKRYRRADGTYIWGILTSVVLRDKDGVAIEYLSQIENISAMKAAAEEKAMLNRKLSDTAKLESLGVLAGGIAHDFNNLLTGVLGNASMLRLELPKNFSGTQMLDEIEMASRSAGELCKQMLAYSGRGRFVLKQLDLNRVIEETAQLLRVSISKQSTLRFNFANELPLIEADATQMGQIVMNLIINASEAGGEKGGIIQITTGVTEVTPEYARAFSFEEYFKSGTYVSLEISDNGSGMSAATLEKIFDPFFTTKFSGRGLGLAAVLGIVRGHKGAVRVYSELGKGTTFKILFPSLTSIALDPDDQDSHTAMPWKGEGVVLIVDDEELVRRVAARMIEKLAFRVEEAVDGRSAIELFRLDPSKYSLVLLDLTMPQIDGEETFRQMRMIHPGVRVILTSGFNHQEVITRFAGKGLSGFIQKPFDAKTLFDEVRRCLSEA